MGSRKKLNRIAGLHLTAANTCSLQTSGDSKLLAAVQNIHNPMGKLTSRADRKATSQERKRERKSFVNLQVYTIILWVLSGRVTHGKKDSCDGSSVSYVVNT